MAKRFTSTELWKEDWFIDIPTEYKLFWFYMLSACDHAGVYKVNVKQFCTLHQLTINPNKAIVYFNEGKERIRILNDTMWLIEDFYVFQYGVVFNYGNRLHASIGVIYENLEVNLSSIRGLKEVKYGVKDKDKVINSIYTKVKLTENDKEIKPIVNFKAQGEVLFAERTARGNKADNNGQSNNQGKG